MVIGDLGVMLPPSVPWVAMPVALLLAVFAAAWVVYRASARQRFGREPLLGMVPGVKPRPAVCQVRKFGQTAHAVTAVHDPARLCGDGASKRPAVLPAPPTVMAPMRGKVAPGRTSALNYMVPMVVEKTHEGERSYDLYSRMLKDNIVFITGPIDDAIAAVAIAQIMYCVSKGARKVVINLNTPGGSIAAGMALYDCIRYTKAQIEVCAMGQVASIGTLILAAADVRNIQPNTRVLMHQPSGSSGMAQASDIQATSEEVLRVKRMIIARLAERTCRDPNYIEELIDREHWMDAKETVAFGLADHIIISKEEEYEMMLERKRKEEAGEVSWDYDSEYKLPAAEENQLTEEEQFKKELFQKMEDAANNFAEMEKRKIDVDHIKASLPKMREYKISRDKAIEKDPMWEARVPHPMQLLLKQGVEIAEIDQFQRSRMVDENWGHGWREAVWPEAPEDFVSTLTDEEFVDVLCTSRDDLYEQRRAWRENEMREVFSKGGIEDVDAFMEQGRKEFEEQLPKIEMEQKRSRDVWMKKNEKIKETRRRRLRRAAARSRGLECSSDSSEDDFDDDSDSDDEVAFIPRVPREEVESDDDSDEDSDEDTEDSE